MLSLYVRMMTRAQDAQRGAVASEYAILLALIAVAMVAAVTLLGGNITAAINAAAAKIPGGTPAP